VKEMLNDECGMMNEEAQASSHSSFIIPRSSFLLFFVLASLFAFASSARAQDASNAAPAPTPRKSRPRGSITGRVVAEDGQPIFGARIVVGMKRGDSYNGESVATNADGSFKVENLEAAPYTVSAYAPGYFDASYFEYERGVRDFHRPGDDVSIRLMRGGVITGRVTDSHGEPAAGVRVNLVRVRTLEGSPVRQVNHFMGSLERTTDDRGVYRSYGLLPGVYVVSAGGRFSSNYFGALAHADEAPTFYPSATRDATTEVTVRAGEEVAAVDIRLRGERGHAISGTVAGVTEAAHAEQGTIINVISADSTEYAGQVYLYGRTEKDSFSFEGLADGDYDLVADRYSTLKNWTRIGTSSRRVQIRGADVTGVKITFAPLGSLSGRIVFETPSATVEAKSPSAAAKPSNVEEAKPSTNLEAKASDSKEVCKGTADALWSGAAVLARREITAGLTLPASEPSVLDNSPDEKGEFNFNGLIAGTYRLELKLSDGYFVTGVRRGARPPETGAAVLTLKQGEQVSDVVVSAAYGAASIEGRLSFSDCEGCAPARARLYLIPQERERAEDALRYAEASVERKGREGQFSFEGLAPGRYTLLALPEPARKRGEVERPAFADADTRARLRRDAEAHGTRITLAPCEHAEGVALSYASTEKQNREQ